MEFGLVLYTHSKNNFFSSESGDYEEAPLLNAILDETNDEEELVGDVIAFVVGGFHTTGNFLAWIIYYLVS